MALLIGPSNGWLFNNGINCFDDHINFFREAGVNAVEFSISFDKKSQEIIKRDLGLGLKFKSAHLPSFNKVDNSLNEHIDLLKKVAGCGKFDSLLIHPTDVPKEFWDFVFEESISLSVENMDKRNVHGWKLDELKKFLDFHDVNFVFDVQHAFEHDPSMEYAKRLFDLVKDRLSHFHVSGENSNYYHILLHKSDNKDVILDFLRYAIKIKKAPLIIEGKYKTVEELKKSIEFLRDNLS